jgi:hypothetical protein
VEKFLSNLYKQCAFSNGDGTYQLFDVIPTLLGQRKFEAVDGIMKDVDLSKIDTSTMYSLIHLTASYIHQLPHYRPTYKRVREEFARRGESSQHINDLFDQYENGWKDRLFNPDEPIHQSHTEKFEEKLRSKIVWAQQTGDKDLVDMLTFYQAERLRRDERDHKFREMRHLLGEDEVKRRAITSLRKMADLLEENSTGWPGIYYCDLPEDPLLKKTFIDGIEVVISYPWPG